jgi:hypothetical protein
VSLTSLEQVFIKLAHEVDNSQVSKSKSIYSKAGKVWQNVTRNPMRILARRGSRRTQPETESDRKIQSGQSQYIRSESEGKSQDHSVNDTNDSVSSESRKANPLMESNMDLTTCTDNYSEDGALNSSVRTTSLPKLVSILPVSITAPSIAKKYDEPTAPYDNEHSSHGSTSFRTHESDRSQGQNNERDEPEDAHGANEVRHSSAMSIILLHLLITMSNVLLILICSLPSPRNLVFCFNCDHFCDRIRYT